MAVVVTTTETERTRMTDEGVSPVMYDVKQLDRVVTHEDGTSFHEKAGVLEVLNSEKDIIAVYAREWWRSAVVVATQVSHPLEMMRYCTGYEQGASDQRDAEQVAPKFMHVQDPAMRDSYSGDDEQVAAEGAE